MPTSVHRAVREPDFAAAAQAVGASPTAVAQTNIVILAHAGYSPLYGGIHSHPRESGDPFV